MSEWMEFTAKSAEEALAEALISLNLTSEQVEYEILERESLGFFGLFNNKPARIRIRKKEEEVQDKVDVAEFISKILKAMQIEATVETEWKNEDNEIDIQINGNDMGVLIGKRGQTLDSLQYLASLYVNKKNEGYIKVKLDTENYRERRKETLENLAVNIAQKVKRTHHSVTLEPMNPYERRIIHSSLQNDKFVETHSEGEEPFRKVVVTMKKGVREYTPNPRYNRDNRTSNKDGAPKRFPSSQQAHGSHDGYKRKFNNDKFNDKKDFVKKYGENTKDYSKDYKKDYAAYLEQKAAAKAAVEAEKNND